MMPDVTTPGAGGSPTPAERNVAAARRMIAAINRGDWSAVRALLAPDFVEHPALVGWPASHLLAAFPDLGCVALVFVAEGDMVAVRCAHHGTHRKPLLGIPATGRWVTWTAMYLSRWTRDGRLAELWRHDDVYGLLGQIGAVITAGAGDA